MISKELFIKLIQDIKDQEVLDEKLTELLVDPESRGWIATGDKLMNDLIHLMQEILGDKYDYINWWLYDIPDGEKYVGEIVNCGAKERIYNLNELESLYYYILGDYDKVPSKLVPYEKVEQGDVTSKMSLKELVELWGE